MAQYCRYCEFVNRAFGICTCQKTGKTLLRPMMKHTNECGFFKLNPVDALRENISGYKPNGKKIVQYGGLGKQITMEELLEEG